jgi:TonB family protein
MDNLSDDIVRYKKGELSPEQMHALEKKALSDPFLAEALEGIENISADELASDISEIEKKILHKRNPARAGLLTPLRIAAGLFLVTSSVFIVYQFIPKAETIALKIEKSKPENKKEDGKPSAESGNADKNVERKKLNIESESRKSKMEPISPGSQSPKSQVKDSVPLKQNTITEIQPSFQETPVQDLAAIEEQMEKAQAENDKVSKEVVSNEPKAAGANAISRAKKKDLAASEAQQPAAPIAKFQTLQSFSGQVVAAEDGSPLPGVNVNVKGTSIGALTDLKGNYSISTESEHTQLVFSFIGFQQQEVNASGKNKIDVKMNEDATQLSEVVVTGFGLAKDEDRVPIITLAEPIGGKKAYDKYLESNLKYPEEALTNKIKGKVGIEFTVDLDGSLKDFQVIKKLGYGCEEEVIRLIKEGPKWTPSTEDNKPTESTVRVRMRFDPAKSGR